MYQILQNKFYTNAGHNNLEKKTKTCFLQVGYEKLKPLINLFFFYFFTTSTRRVFRSSTTNPRLTKGVGVVATPLTVFPRSL